MSLILVSLCICLCLAVSANSHSSWSKSDYRPKILSRSELATLAQKGPRSDVFNYTLDHILIPRVSGTPNNLKVYNFIRNHYEELGWTIQEDLFTANTPLGSKEFRNLIVTLNPNACKRLVFACHYDSKYFKSGNFVGATDSAVPCSMLMTIATDLDPVLKTRQDSRFAGTTLQFIFFDGEEAFGEWSDTDSLYGSRHLADKLNRTPVTPEGVCDGTVVSEIDRIELFVLLDLLGASKPAFYSYFPDTDVYYARMLTIEQELNNAGLMSSSSNGKATGFFRNRRSFGMIEDDHIPFMRRGVKILHVIASPFPSVWHKLSDDASALHHGTIRDLIAIFKSFIAEFLHLDVAGS